MKPTGHKLPIRMCVALLIVAALGANVSTARALDAGGHVGVALPLINFCKETTNLVDETVIATPFGIGLQLIERFTVDFETVVFTPAARGGRTAFIAEPGLEYHAGPVNHDLRVACQVAQPSNIGAIPLVVPLVKLSLRRGSWKVPFRSSTWTNVARLRASSIPGSASER